MTRVAALVCAIAALGSPVAARAADSVTVSVDRTRVSTVLGRNFALRTAIDNHGAAPTPPLVAHLNVLSLRSGVYVDPEDWSSNRTRWLGSIPAGGSRNINWNIKAVNGGEIGVYVAVLPQSGAAQPPVTGSTVHVSISERRTLNSGGILPLAAGIPAFLAALAVGVRLRRRRA